MNEPNNKSACSVFEKEYHYHPYIGRFIKCYIRCTNDYMIRKNSASGGLISQLLIHPLESKQIDGAVVTKLQINDGKLEAHAFIAKSKSEILSVAGSHYLQVNFSDVIQEMIDKEGSYAIVALPCMVSSLIKLQKKQINT